MRLQYGYNTLFELGSIMVRFTRMRCKGGINFSSNDGINIYYKISTCYFYDV